MRSVVAMSFLILLFKLLGLNLPAQTWNYIKEKNGIKIYTRIPENSAFKCFKGETVFHASMQELGLYIGNVKNFNWWDKNIRELRVLDPGSASYIQYYFIYHVPWPLNDRDLCVEVFISTDTLNGKKVVYARPLPGVIPQRKGIVRITDYWQKWTLIPLGKDSVQAILEGFVDPGGSVPAWLYNLVIVETPLKVIEGIKQKAEAKKPH
ncbi:MAG: hypothetical protein ACOYM0_08205 [Bacteroidales bacterium]